MKIDAWDYGEGRWAYSTRGHVDFEEFYEAIEEQYGSNHVLLGDRAEHRGGTLTQPAFTILVCGPLPKYDPFKHKEE